MLLSPRQLACSGGGGLTKPSWHRTRTKSLTDGSSVEPGPCTVPCGRKDKTADYQTKTHAVHVSFVRRRRLSLKLPQTCDGLRRLDSHGSHDMFGVSSCAAENARESASSHTPKNVGDLRYCCTSCAVKIKARYRGRGGGGDNSTQAMRNHLRICWKYLPCHTRFQIGKRKYAQLHCTS